MNQQAEVAQHFVGDRMKTTHVNSVSEIAPGSGAVVRAEGRPCAVYRNEDGTAHAVSARCTHLGCLVAFNEAETVWECPCHGSPFGVDGEVLQGPAVRPLSGVLSDRPPTTPPSHLARRGGRDAVLPLPPFRRVLRMRTRVQISARPSVTEWA